MSSVIQIKTPEEIEKIANAGKIAKYALEKTLENIKVGISTLELDKIAESAILEKGATPGFKLVEDYKFATCININDGLVHGLPSEYRLKEGDIVSIDLGAYLDGWHSDLSHTVEVNSNKNEKFLKIGEKALEEGIKQVLIGNRIGDIGFAMQTIVEAAGYTVSRDLVGHGVGRELHEDPYVPGYGRPGKGEEIKEGMVLAVEIIYQAGKPEITVLEDGWTIATADRSLAAVFEHTVAATKNGPKVLTI